MTQASIVEVGERAAADLEAALDAVVTDASASSMARRDVPRALLRPSTMRGLVRMALEEWTAIVICWLALALAPDAFLPWLYVPLCVLLAGRFHALGVLLHDAAHMPLRRKTRLAFAVEALCGYPVASTIEAMRYHHLRHHRDSGMETDPYFKAGVESRLWWTLNVARGALLVPFWTLRALVGACALIVPRLRNGYARIFLQDKSGADVTQSSELIACARAELPQLACQALLVVAAILWPRAISLGYFVPITIAAVLSARRLLLEHTYEPAADRRIETIIATTRDNHVDWLGRLLLAPRNVGCHIVHHIHPQVGLAHLPRLRAWYRTRHANRYPSPRTGSET
jgi:fatty acid desaturase